MSLFASMGGALSAFVAGPAIRRAAEWERIEADLIHVTGSPEAALKAAGLAVEAAKLGFESPEQLARVARDAYTGSYRHANDLRSMGFSLDLQRKHIRDMLDALDFTDRGEPENTP